MILIRSVAVRPGLVVRHLAGPTHICLCPQHHVVNIRNVALADEEDLKRRALSAYFKSGGTHQPSSASGVMDVDGLRYVRLFAAGRMLAVYRVDTVGRLKRLKRWPKALDDV